ncbi:MAG: hypothetical protein PVJ84_18905 [Desulfobacteraceae bacterium]|jgi:hypothetical protein
MRKITKGFILPSAAFTLKPSHTKYYKALNRIPEPGDVVYGQIVRIGQHSTLENVSGRIHNIHNGSRCIFVYGHRYAPDYYEGFVPEDSSLEVDLLARSGIIGKVKTKNTLIKDPTRVRVLGYVCAADGQVLNTRQFSMIKPKNQIKKTPRSPMILVCGTSMNSGKSMAAVACCWVLSSAGYNVRASKVAGTASLKDILHMNDAGASHYTDFTLLGHPSTYMLDQSELLHVFNTLDLKYANNPKNFWIVEFADGIIQRETSMLLQSEEVRSRIHRLILCANDAFGAIGGLKILEENYGMKPDAISGVCSSSPLHIRELSAFTDIPVFNSANPDQQLITKLLIEPSKIKRSKKKTIKAA